MMPHFRNGNWRSLPIASFSVILTASFFVEGSKTDADFSSVHDDANRNMNDTEAARTRNVDSSKNRQYLNGLTGGRIASCEGRAGMSSLGTAHIKLNENHFGSISDSRAGNECDASDSHTCGDSVARRCTGKSKNATQYDGDSLQKQSECTESKDCEKGKDTHTNCDVALGWIQHGTSTRVLCSCSNQGDMQTLQHQQQLQRNNGIGNYYRDDMNVNGFDPASSNFFEIQIIPSRKRVSELSIHASDLHDGRSGGEVKDPGIVKVELGPTSGKPDDLAAISMPTIMANTDTSTPPAERVHQKASSSPLPAPILNNTVVILPNLLTLQECDQLVRDAERILDETRHPGVKTEKWAQFFRFEDDSKVIMERMLREYVLSFIRLRLPAVAEELFQWRQPHESSSSLSVSPPSSLSYPECAPIKNESSGTKSTKPIPIGKPMAFYWDDPVVIKYTAGNRVAPHQDMRELTIVIPLQTSLEGGGTRFWPEGTSPENAGADLEGGVLINPPPGSGVIFHGDMTHSGSSVVEGTRFILMTSINLDVDDTGNEEEGDEDERIE